MFGRASGASDVVEGFLLNFDPSVRDEEGNVVNKLDFLSAKAALFRAYDKSYGICDHSSDAGSPLSSVLHHAAESSERRTAFTNRLEDYIAYDIKRIFGIDFDALIAMPRDRVEEILNKGREIVDAREKKKADDEGKQPR